MSLTRLYRKFVPETFRNSIYKCFLRSTLKFVRDGKVSMMARFIYTFQSVLPRTEINELYRFMSKYGITAYPYGYMLPYKKMDFDVFEDPGISLKYVIHDNKRLYFPENLTAKDVKNTYRSLIIEQDINCAHRYVESYEELRGKTLLDIGSAEGIFALDTVEYVEKVYLFECDPLWTEALQATFKPYREKVVLVQKYVSDEDGIDTTTIDSYLDAKSIEDLFIKMDIEGYEVQALRGMQDTLKNTKNISCSICVYHRDNDASEVEEILKNNSFECEFTKGYLFMNQKFRKGVIRGSKR